MSCFKFGEILLPKKLNTKNWAVVACDQYTSDKGYWESLKKSLVFPTTLDLIFPECFLNDADKANRIDSILSAQDTYSDDVLTSLDGTILLKRSTPFGNTHYGLMMLVDLNDYSTVKGGKPLIRPTEGVVESRIPPRVEIRKNCRLELPHIMLLVDDKDDSVIGPYKDSKDVVYQGELNGNGGHIVGYHIKNTDTATTALNELLKNSIDKYGEELLFLVGDGNHSLATAKACVDDNNSKSRYALVEVVNLYDVGIEFKAIYRLVYNTDNNKFIKGLKERIKGTVNVPLYNGKAEDFISLPEDAIEGVKAVQEYIDEYASENSCEVDYIHGEEELRIAAKEYNGVGISLLPMEKSRLFPYIVKNGPLPKKTFSMGEANEKRYYIEARFIK